MSKFTIPGKLPSLNDMLRVSRHHYMAYNAMKTEWRTTVGQIIVASRVPFFKDPVCVSFTWIEPDKRRDLDNISAAQKFILDALVDTDRLKNDTRQYVRMLAHYFPEPDKKNPRVEVEITPFAWLSPCCK